MGSVKDLTIIEEPVPGKPGKGRFSFSDRYSVFDWGQMPQYLENKGKALCLTGAYFFEKLQQQGFKTHYIGSVSDGEVRGLADLKGPADTMEVKLLRVLKPGFNEQKYDYSVYKNERSNFLIPLEIIYRNTLPAGSSVFKRLDEGTIKLSDMGLLQLPSPGQDLAEPIFDVSTKLESTDRYVNWAEAQQMACLSDKELSRIKDTLMAVNALISEEARRIGLKNNDGKIELGFDEDRNLLILDVVGTPDECRFTMDDLQVSKEIARIYYRDTDWFKDINEAKKKDSVNWKQYVKTPPPDLPVRLAELISYIYQAFCNELTQRKWFEVPTLKETIEEINTIVKLD
ncbi:phosphoribosylaminoimidazolesuccinocarboxamide synthase [Elusimicrobiota bacterium]